jgi:hypothetical protein
VVYEIWRDDSWNLSGAFPTQAEALAALRAALDAGQVDLVRGCTLALVDSRGRRRTVAEGQQLIDRALARRPVGEHGRAIRSVPAATTERRSIPA